MTLVRNPAARRAELKRVMTALETASVETLCDRLGASPATIRRDLAALEEEGVLTRTHGGATLLSVRPAEQNFAEREATDVEEKQLIARTVVGMISPGSTVFLNDGSTIMAIARAIVSDGMEVFVVTPAVNVATKLSESPVVTSCLLGGFMRMTSLSTSGPFTEAMSGQINADLAVISPDGITARSGATFINPADAGLARRMAQQSRKVAVVATSRKVNLSQRICAIETNEISRLVTVPGADVAQFAATDVDIVFTAASAEGGSRDG